MKHPLCLMFVLLTLRADAENWPQFRGPSSRGCSSESNLPLQWSATENVAWKTPIPGQSWSSPIVWANHVFLTTATDEGKFCHVLALDRKSGKILWDKEVFEQSIGRKEGRNTYATPTPAADGERVYACFFDGSFVALDFAGNVLWTNRSYPFYGQHGLGTSPILYSDLLIMARDGSNSGEEKGLGWQKPWDQAFLIALDTGTGKERWKARRGLSRISHCVPTVCETPGGQPQLVSEAGDVVQGFDLRTGDRLWSSEVIGEGKVPSTVVGGGLVFTAGGWGGRESIKAFGLGGQGELGTNNLVWEQKGIMPKVPSMLYLEGRLYAVTDSGMASCMRADSGEVLWKERLPGSYSASPVAAAGRLYFTSDNGETTVIEAAPNFSVLAKNPIGEKVQASLAVSQGQIFIRTEKHLFAIGQQPSAENSLTNTSSRVRIVKKDRGFQLLRNEQPYFVKGAVVGPGGSLEALRTAGANSIRTQPGMLDEAERKGFTALVGLPLGNPRKGFNYTDAAQVKAQFERARDIVRKYRRHPALLCWNLGNEPEIQTTPAERVPLWKEVNRLAEMVKQEDPDHPVMAVIGGQYADMLHELNEYCPALDLVGLNSYAQMLKLPEEIAKQGWSRPYIVTEFGPRGHWQVPKTAWKVPIEDDANAKAEFYLQAYQHAISGQAACLGSYVFYWAHKQEKTHTWYGMFLPDGSRTPAIDAMSFLWTGQWPTNRCPILQGTKLTVALAENKERGRPGLFLPGTKLACAIEVSDPDNDPLRITWELRPDVADNPKVGGDWEPGVEPLSGLVLSTTDEGRRAVLQLPPRPGKYRLFVYAHDDHGNATTANTPLLAEYPPVPPWQPDTQQREHLRRSLTLLQTSTPTDRKTVRVLFYGQSITQQAWWKEVERYLCSTYINANLVVENRAIGGHSSQLLVKTAEADLYPFQPDLLIFHVYGSHLEYENIIRRVRERTCADILLQTDHITQDRSLTEETDPAKLTPKDWDAWMNNAFLPTTAAKYGACRADVHEQWKQYLKAHHLKAADLLRDGVHLNAHGEWLMAELLNAYLAPLPPKSGYDPLNESRVRTVSVPSSSDRSSLRLEFTGTRADLLWTPKATGSVSVMIDGKKPSTIPELYGFTRVSAFPGSDWPLLLRVQSGAPLVAEDWSMKIDQVSSDGKLCHFRLLGTVTGDDGEGYSTNRFVSKSGRIVIEPEDWNLAYSIGVFKRPLPENHTATWRAVLRGTDNAEPPDPALGTEACFTLVQGLSPGAHVLELRGSSLPEQLRGVRFYCPQNAATPGSQSAPPPQSQ